MQQSIGQQSWNQTCKKFFLPAVAAEASKPIKTKLQHTHCIKHEQGLSSNCIHQQLSGTFRAHCVRPSVALRAHAWGVALQAPQPFSHLSLFSINNNGMLHHHGAVVLDHTYQPVTMHCSFAPYNLVYTATCHTWFTVLGLLSAALMY